MVLECSSARQIKRHQVSKNNGLDSLKVELSRTSAKRVSIRETYIPLPSHHRLLSIKPPSHKPCSTTTGRSTSL
ncbi:hypothetical protein Peur_041526 [Populus x canadensis]